MEPSCWCSSLRRSPFSPGFFILISGISSQLSHSNLIRGLKLLGVALALTLVTYFIIPSELIVFGILHMLSVCMIVFGLGQKLWDRIPLILGLAVCAVLFLITMPVSDGYLGLPGTLAWKIPAGWYEFGWLFPLGIHRADFFSADYFPLFPWIFLFFCGTYIGRWARNGKFPDFTYRLRFTSLSWMGRHAPDFISYPPAADLRRVHFNFLDHFPLAGLAPRLAARLQLYRYLLLREDSAMDFTTVLCDQFHLQPWQVNNVIQLLDEGNTIPLSPVTARKRNGDWSL